MRSQTSHIRVDRTDIIGGSSLKRPSNPDSWNQYLILFRAIFWFESNYEKLMPEKIEEASECVELLIMQKQLTVTQKVIST